MRTFLLGLGASAMILAAASAASAQNFGQGGYQQNYAWTQQTNGWSQRTNGWPVAQQRFNNQAQGYNNHAQVGYSQPCPTCGPNPMGYHGGHGGGCGPHGCNNGSCYGGGHGCNGIYGSGVPVMAPPAYQPGPPSGTVTYPYYTVRGPRDFLMANPPPLGP